LTDPTSWHKGETYGASPERGTFSFTGSPSSAACEFNDGVNLDAASKYGTFNFNVLKGGVTFWAKMNASSSTNVGFLYNSYVAGQGQIVCFFYSTGLINCDFYIESSPGVQLVDAIYRMTSGPLSWSANDKIHWALTWDGSASAGNRIKLYMNKVDQSIPVYSGDADWSSYSGGDISAMTTQYGGSYALGGIFDNVKVYEGYCPTQSEIDWDYANEGLYVAPVSNQYYIINC
jgi:hypothetical protein